MLPLAVLHWEQLKKQQIVSVSLHSLTQV
uniref:Uncharacterized protein n=1 Tax=Anguilla anguilla TaxID=7936 RepID=A0A0E9SWI1_ANGAN